MQFSEYTILEKLDFACEEQRFFLLFGKILRKYRSKVKFNRVKQKSAKIYQYLQYYYALFITGKSYESNFTPIRKLIVIDNRRRSVAVVLLLMFPMMSACYRCYTCYMLPLPAPL